MSEPDSQEPIISVSMVLEVFEDCIRLTARHPRGESRYDRGAILLRFQADETDAVFEQLKDAYSSSQLDIAYRREEQRLLAIGQADKDTTPK